MHIVTVVLTRIGLIFSKIVPTVCFHNNSQKNHVYYIFEFFMVGIETENDLKENSINE